MSNATQQDAPVRYRGWVRPGPVAPGLADPAVVGDDETLDFLCGHWRIFQLKKGHRYSVDDVLLAWYATSWAPRVERALDLGSGIGSVALTSAWRLPAARYATIEAQAVSAALARKSIRYNGVADRFTVIEGDMRDAAVQDAARAHGPFDLITGSPPYWPQGAALASAHAQAVPARLEVRGDVSDYARTAASLLAPGGLFACVFQASQDARVRDALRGAGLTLLRSRAVAFKEGTPPETAGIVLYAAMRAEDLPSSFAPGTAGKPVMEPVLPLRTPQGHTHPEYATIRLSYGFPPGDMAADPLTGDGA